MPNRAGDWLRQAIRDLEHAEAARADTRHEWACFAWIRSQSRFAAVLRRETLWLVG